MLNLFNEISFKTSYVITRSYSTSFSSAVRLLDREVQDAIYSIYGFVRFADEIVDTFHSFDKKKLLEEFERDYYEAIRNGISMNPVLNSFQLTVTKYGIPDDLIQAFLNSMKTDLFKQNHNTKTETETYIYGSAEVVGLMCLRVFVLGNSKLYNELEAPAKSLGSAFQKVNFLRDIMDDTELLNRHYFHNSVQSGFNEMVKTEIVDDIEKDFAVSFQGIKRLPGNSKLGVLTAYYYYKKLLKKIKDTPADELLRKRVRVPDLMKMHLLIKAYLACKLRLLN
jgi:phytoene/squalene synthetase